MGNLCCGAEKPNFDVAPKAVFVRRNNSPNKNEIQIPMLNLSQVLENEDEHSVSGTYSEKMGLVTDRTNNDEYLKKLTQRNSLRPPQDISGIQIDQSAILPDQTRFETTFFDQSMDFSGVIIILEYFKMELVNILPTIQEAAKMALQKDEKMQKKHIKKLSKNVSELKWDVVQEHTQEFSTLKKFESHVKHSKKNSQDLQDLVSEIDFAIQKALNGEPWPDLVRLDDPKIDKDGYFQILFKFYAAMRHDLYTKIQQFWNENKNQLMIELNKRSFIKKDEKPELDNPSTEEENPIDDQNILRIAKEIDCDKIYVKVFELLGVQWNHNLQLSLRKMEHIFLQDENNQNYVDCLTEAHNQMLYVIQDPFNTFEVMKDNPLDSPEPMFGVPKDFGDMLMEITRYGEQEPSDKMSVEKEPVDCKSETEFFKKDRRNTDFKLGFQSTQKIENNGSFFGGSVNKIDSDDPDAHDDVEIQVIQDSDSQEEQFIRLQNDLHKGSESGFRSIRSRKQTEIGKKSMNILSPFMSSDFRKMRSRVDHIPIIIDSDDD